MAENILLVVEEKKMRHLPPKPHIREETAENPPVLLGQRKELIYSKARGWIKCPLPGMAVGRNVSEKMSLHPPGGPWR